jgi:N6-adenosine-specific RNA methylase IME4
VKFGCLLADPPWKFRVWGSAMGSRTAETFYPTEETGWIEGLPIREVAAKDCTLLLWATNPHLPDAMRVIKAWGFEYKTMITWMKMRAAAAPRIGLGYHARSCTEHLMIASRGNPGAPPEDRRPCGAFFCPRGEHSAKPDYQYDIAELYAGPYLELFHRPRGGMFGPREGWHFLGNEVSGRDIRDDLNDLIAQEKLAA